MCKCINFNYKIVYIKNHSRVLKSMYKNCNLSTTEKNKLEINEYRGLTDNKQMRQNQKLKILKK